MITDGSGIWHPTNAGKACGGWGGDQRGLIVRTSKKRGEGQEGEQQEGEVRWKVKGDGRKILSFYT